MFAMYKALAVLRTVFLVFIVGFTVWTTALASYPSAVESARAVGSAAWIAIAWIGFETLVGWLLASRSRPNSGTRLPPPPAAGSPPSARP
jgi:hypothetical protein